MKRSILFLSFFLFNCFVFSSDFTAFLRFSGALSNDALFSREIEVENFHVSKKFPFKCSLSISQESFHNVLWGPTNRFGMKCNLLFGEKNDLFLKTGAGIGFTDSYGFSSFSPDVYFKLYYRIFFVFLDTSFYTDGIFNKNGIGIEFKIGEILFDAGLSNIIVSDYEYSVLKLRFEAGAGYEF